MVRSPTRPGSSWLDRALAALSVGAPAFAAGVIVATGVAAAIAFPTMKTLDPSLPGFAAVPDHWMIAAGRVMAPIFTITVAGAVLAMALATLAWALQVLRAQFGVRVLLVRGVALLLTLAVAGHLQFALLPRMNANFATFLAAARAGDTNAALTARDAFDQDHPSSGREFGAVAALALVCAGLSILPTRRRDRSA